MHLHHRSFVAALALLCAVGPGGAAAAGESGEPGPGAIGFTFDDGPHPTWTPVVLEALDRLDIKATFFVLGLQVARYPGLAREIVSRGHSIQIHGLTHRPFTTLSDEEIAGELRRTSDLIYWATGVRPTCVRPPYGATSPRVRRVITASGFHEVIWDVNSVDYSAPTPRASYHQVLRKTEPGDDILGHDTLGWVWRDILPGLVEAFTERGYGFDTICGNLDPQTARFAPGAPQRWVGA